MGNSITKHSITDFWWGNWGMAATVRENDWVHVLQNMITAKQGYSPVFSTFNMGTWETAFDTFDKTAYDGYFDGDEDLVVLRIGENVTYSATFKAEFAELVDYIKSKAPKSRILIASNFWSNASMKADQQVIASEKGCLYVKLSQLNTTENKATLNTQVYGDNGVWHTISEGGEIASGVANHPNDLVMNRIAEAIFSELITNLSFASFSVWH